MKLIPVDLCSSMTETPLSELVNVALNVTGATKPLSRPSIVVVDVLLRSVIVRSGHRVCVPIGDNCAEC